MTNILYGTGGKTIFGSQSDDSISPASLTSIDNDTLFGRGGNDSLNGGSGNDTLFGGSGADFIQGGSGNDVISVETNLSGFGNDRISGGTGFDRVVFKTAALTDVAFGNPIVSIQEAKTGVAVNLINTFFPGGVSDFTANLDADGEVSNSFFAISRGSIRDLNGTTSVLADIEQFDLTAHGDLFLDSSANHIIKGGDGNDFISGGGGFDVIDGGAGIDTAMYRFSTEGVSVSLLDFGSGGNGSGGEAEGDTLFSIENVHGSQHNDFMLGDGNANVLRGFGGNDTLLGGGGNDTLAGGEGNDTLRGGLGNDRIEGGAGTDTALFQDWNGFSSSLFNTVRGNIALADGENLGTATLFRSTFNLTTKTTTTTGIDTDILFGIENVTASDQSETITGNSANNVLDGRGGSDILDGGKGNDSLIGGDGIDTAVFAASAAGEDMQVIASLTSGTASITRTVVTGNSTTVTTETDTLSGIENLTGSSGLDSLTGDATANILKGEGGNDTLNGRGGADVLNGGDGFDTAAYNSSAIGVNVNLALNIATGGEAEGDTFVSIENLTGSFGNDVLVGSAGNNIIFGGGGNDTIEGGGGADRLDGQSGLNTLSYASSSGVTMSLDGSLAATGDAFGDQIFNFRDLSGSETGNDTLRGDDLANIITGNGGNDILSGGGGSDRLDGGDGFDFADYSRDGAVTINLANGLAEGAAAGDQFISIEGIMGGVGNNVMRGDGNANAFIATNFGDNLFRGRGGDDTLTGAGGKDTLQGDGGNDNINGGAGDDRLIGNSGDDLLNGSFGNDLLKGGTGNDMLTGGLGRDTFVFTGQNNGQDTITDFQDGIDVIQFRTGLVDSFEDLAIAGNGTQHATVIYGDQSIDIFSTDAINLSSDDFAII